MKMSGLRIEGGFNSQDVEIEDTIALRVALEDNLESGELGQLVDGGISDDNGQFYILMLAPKPELVKSFLAEILAEAELQNDVTLHYFPWTDDSEE